MKLEVGMYVRTKKGYIAQITEISESKKDCNRKEYKDIYTDVKTEYIFSDKTENVVKSSFNLIDLIEVGDYVNGYEIEQILYGSLWYDASDTRDCCIKPKDIKSIVTKEQFERVSYKLGDK